MKKYCLIGKSLPHTMSPQIHNEFGLDYSVVELQDEKALRTFVLSKEYDGFNVTIPFKQTIMKYLDEIDKTALKIGAVNTVVKSSGKYIGFNTDIGGMDFAMSLAHIKLNQKSVMILGSGGSSKTAQYLAKREGAKEIIVVSRSGEVNYENCYNFQDTEIIINATPVGMMPHAEEMPIDVLCFQNLEAVFDSIYNPLCTRLIFEAKERNIISSNGLNMLVEQARLAHDIFTGDKTNQIRTVEIANKLQKQKQNIILIGMAGAGKSVIGRQLAQNTGREFFDTDTLIEQREGVKVNQIFNKFSEKYFRDLESDVIVEVSKKQHTVIATGGGGIMKEQNRRALNANGKIVLIIRDLELLEFRDRPLYKDFARVQQMWEERKNVYFSIADIVVENNKSLSEVVAEIMEKL